MKNPLTWLVRNVGYFLLPGLVGVYLWSTHVVRVMHARGKYTVGYVTGWTQTLKSGRSIDYTCTIDGVVYHSSVHEEPGMNAENGTRYVVEYDSVEPKTNWAYYKMPVPPGIGPPPAGGWNKKTYQALLRADSLRHAPSVRQQDSFSVEQQSQR